LEERENDLPMTIRIAEKEGKNGTALKKKAGHIRPWSVSSEE